MTLSHGMDGPSHHSQQPVETVASHGEYQLRAGLDYHSSMIAVNLFQQANMLQGRFDQCQPRMPFQENERLFRNGFLPPLNIVMDRRFEASIMPGAMYPMHGPCPPFQSYGQGQLHGRFHHPGLYNHRPLPPQFCFAGNVEGYYANPVSPLPPPYCGGNIEDQNAGNLPPAQQLYSGGNFEGADACNIAPAQQTYSGGDLQSDPARNDNACSPASYCGEGTQSNVIPNLSLSGQGPSLAAPDQPPPVATEQVPPPCSEQLSPARLEQVPPTPVDQAPPATHHRPRRTNQGPPLTDQVHAPTDQGPATADQIGRPSDCPITVPVPHLPDGDLTMTGASTITPEKINEVLKAYHSPAAGMGQYIYDQGLKHGINPAMALAFYVVESNCGTKGLAVKNKSWGNVRGDGPHGYKPYDSIKDSLDQWYNLITHLYLGKFHTDKLAPVISHYSPNSDGNNESAYVHRVGQLVRQWAG